MQFRLDNLDKDFKALQKLAETGVDVVCLRNVPRILPAYAWLWEAWDRLSSTRQRTDKGFPEFIAFREILAYCELRGIDDLELRAWLEHIIYTLDQMYVPAVRSYMQATAPKG